MSRLTLPHYGGKGHYMRCSEQFGCSGECADCKELDKIVEKLAEYEDKEERKPSTNADRIRAMSNEELAKHLVEIGWDCHLCAEHSRLDSKPLLRGEKCDEKCVEHCLEWLKQPAEEENNNA